MVGESSRIEKKKVVWKRVIFSNTRKIYFLAQRFFFQEFLLHKKYSKDFSEANFLIFLGVYNI